MFKLALLMFMVCLIHVWSSSPPTRAPTRAPSNGAPSFRPSRVPSPAPSKEPTFEPTEEPTFEPTEEPTFEPSHQPTFQPTSPKADAAANPEKLPGGAIAGIFIAVCIVIGVVANYFIKGVEENNHSAIPFENAGLDDSNPNLAGSDVKTSELVENPVRDDTHS